MLTRVVKELTLTKWFSDIVSQTWPYGYFMYDLHNLTSGPMRNYAFNLFILCINIYRMREKLLGHFLLSLADTSSRVSLHFFLLPCANCAEQSWGMGYGLILCIKACIEVDPSNCLWFFSRCSSREYIKQVGFFETSLVRKVCV